MLTQLEAHPRIGQGGVEPEPLIFPIVPGPDANGVIQSGANGSALQIRNIDGLGPVKADILTSPLADAGGEEYAGNFVGKRNVVLKIGLAPDWVTQTMEELRLQLYKYFMSGKWVKLRFISTHLQDVEIEGYTESVEPNIFSKDPELIVSVVCPQSAFVAVTSTVIQGSTIDWTGDPSVMVPYEGNIPTGFEMHLTYPSAQYDTSVSSWDFDLRIINDDRPLEAALFGIWGVKVWAQQELKIGSVPGNKFAQYYNPVSQVITNILGKVQDGSIWPQLIPGDNGIRVYSGLDIPFTLTYFSRYGGL